MNEDRRLSKTLSYWLRHDPAAGGIALSHGGWAEIGHVLKSLKEVGLPHSLDDVFRVVSQSEKNRFEISQDGQLIRARQGHSVVIELDLPVVEPPEFLFHGTVERFLDNIMTEGIKSMARHHVHLSCDRETATAVGARRGKPVVLQIAAGALFASGHDFRRSSNGVWLTSHVPPSHIKRV